MQDHHVTSFWEDTPSLAQALCAPIPIPLPHLLRHDTTQSTSTKKRFNLSEDGSLITSDSDTSKLQIMTKNISTSPTISNSRKRQIPPSENHSYLAPAPPPSPALKRHRADTNSVFAPFPHGDQQKVLSAQEHAKGNDIPPSFLYQPVLPLSVPPTVLPLVPAATSTASSTMCENEKVRTSPCTKSHTRRCREKVNEKFANLLETLPSAPAGVEVKHKAQILEYTIQVFRALLARRARLRDDLALATPDSLRDWCANRPLSAFAALYARTHRWPYVETWKRGRLSAAHADASHAHLWSLANATNAISNDHSCGGIENGCNTMGIVERVMNSKRPEWLPTACLGNNRGCIMRREAVEAAGIKVILAVPTLGSDSVLLFMDTREREFGIEAVDKVFALTNVVVDTHNANALAQKQEEEDTSGQIERVAHHQEEKTARLIAQM